MKFLCAVCERFVALSAYRMESGVLYVRCPRCGADNRADPSEPTTPAKGSAVVAPASPAQEQAVRSASAAAQGGDPFAVPANVCSKCVSPRSSNATACASCGLKFEQADAAAFRPEEALATRWVELLGRWGDTKAHEQMVAAASAMGEMAALGRLYRLRLVHSPGDPMAQKGRDEVVRVASASVALASQQGPGHPLWQVVGAAVLLAMALAAAIILIYQLMPPR